MAEKINNKAEKNEGEGVKLTARQLNEKLQALTEEKEKCEKQIEELTAEAADYKDKWYRTAAEFENYKKRMAETRRVAYDDGKTEAITKILFIGDNLDRALSYSIDDSTKEGLNMLLKQYGEVLSSLGLEVIDPTDEPFDPNLHEAIFTKDCDEGQEAGLVDSVFLKGYKMGNKIIRYAQVVVTK